MDIIKTILESAIGQAGILFIVAELLDIVLKRTKDRGLWEDLGLFLKRLGEGVGAAIAGFIPGKKVEPILAEYLAKLDDASDEFIDALIEELKAHKDSEEEE